LRLGRIDIVTEPKRRATKKAPTPTEGVKAGTSLGKVTRVPAQMTDLTISAALSYGRIPVAMGIDASLVKPGFAVLDQQAKILAWKRPDHTRIATEGRVLSIFQIVQEMVRTHKPEVIVIETSAGIRFKGDGWRASDALSFSRGIVWSAIVTSGIYPLPKVTELQPGTIRRELLGWRRGNPGKDDIIEYLVYSGFDLPRDRRGNILNDVADAVALAYYVHILYKNANAGR
jgi:Holliday junction resolvasome RuvABC endonuclease subunit